MFKSNLKFSMRLKVVHGKQKVNFAISQTVYPTHSIMSI